MIRCTTFASSLLFGAVAAAAWLPWTLLASPIVGSHTALELYLIGVTVLYVAALSAPGMRAFSAAAISALAAATAALMARSSTELAIGLAAILGIARSGFLYRTAP